MLRRRWSYLRDLYRRLPVNPGEVPRQECSEEIYRILRENAFEKLDFQGERALRATGYVLSTALIHGFNVITPQDIEDAIDLLPSQISEDEKVLLEEEVPSWFGQTNLEEVDGKYCDSNLGRFDQIYVAPIAPTKDQLVSTLGEPTAISDRTVCQMVTRSFCEHDYVSDDHWSDRCREVSSQELDAFCASVKAELESDGWLKIEDESFERAVWIDPDCVEEKLRQNSAVYSERDLVRSIVELILEPLVEIPDSKTLLLEGYLSGMMRRIEGVYNWKSITTENETWWYSSSHQHKAELLLRAQEYQKAVSYPDRVTTEEVEAALFFLEENDRQLMTILDSSRESLDNAIDMLDFQLEKRRLYSAMEQAKTGYSTEKLDTKIEMDEPPTLYDVAREFKEALREQREDEEDEEDDEPDVYHP